MYDCHIILELDVEEKSYLDEPGGLGIFARVALVAHLLTVLHGRVTLGTGKTDHVIPTVIRKEGFSVNDDAAVRSAVLGCFGQKLRDILDVHRLGEIISSGGIVIRNLLGSVAV